MTSSEEERAHVSRSREQQATAPRGATRSTREGGGESKCSSVLERKIEVRIGTDCTVQTVQYSTSTDLVSGSLVHLSSLDVSGCSRAERLFDGRETLGKVLLLQIANDNVVPSFCAELRA